MANDTRLRTGQCHCGAVRFEAALVDSFNTVRRCTCSLCRMRGAVMVMTETDGVKVLQGADALSSYRFNTGVAEHHFCTSCGVYTHHRRRSNPDEFGVNVACLDGLSPFDFAEVAVNEGRIHPNDADPETYHPIAGWLRYTPNQ